MQFSFTVPGHERVPLALRVGFFRGPAILYQGQPLKRISGRNYALPLPDGSSLTLSLKNAGLDFFVPNVIHDGQTIVVAPPLPGYQQGLIYLPLTLMFVGGALGGACGGFAAYLNLLLFHGQRSTTSKILLSILVILGAAVLWLILVALFEVFIIGLRH